MQTSKISSNAKAFVTLFTSRSCTCVTCRHVGHWYAAVSRSWVSRQKQRSCRCESQIVGGAKQRANRRRKAANLDRRLGVLLEQFTHTAGAKSVATRQSSRNALLQRTRARSECASQILILIICANESRIKLACRQRCQQVPLARRQTFPDKRCTTLWTCVFVERKGEVIVVGLWNELLLCASAIGGHFEHTNERRKPDNFAKRCRKLVEMEALRFRFRFLFFFTIQSICF